MEGDKIGLQIGRLNKPVHQVMIALDVLEEVVDEAIEKEVDLIIAHHPLIYRPLKNITTDELLGRMIEKLLKHNIAVYAAHTNLDVAKGGVNDLLAMHWDYQTQKFSYLPMRVKLKKLVVYVPIEDSLKVKEALGNAGAGAIGNYSHCLFSSTGTGQFLPGEESNPYIGESGGELQQVEEDRIETIFPDYLEKRVLQAMMKAHPYEEVAYDIYPLDNKGETLGLGRIGRDRRNDLR